MIRSATADDATSIAQVCVEAWRWAYADVMPPATIAEYADLDVRTASTRRMAARGNLFLVSEDEGRVVGYALEFLPTRIEGGDAEIGSLYVHPDAARKGVGRALVGEFARRKWAEGSRSLAVNTMAANPIGRGFYERLGGTCRPAEDWEGMPCVVYVWDEAGMKSLFAVGA